MKTFSSVEDSGPPDDEHGGDGEYNGYADSDSVQIDGDGDLASPTLDRRKTPHDGETEDPDDLEDSEFEARLRAASDAEPRAVEELVREFQPNLTAYARSRRFPDPDAVVNETLSDGLRNLPTFRGRDRRAFRAYLYRILRRRIVDEYRRSSRQLDTIADAPSDLEARLIDENTSSFDENIVAASAVDDILANLTTEQREVLEMRVLAGLSIKETADLTGRSESAVKAMHRRALLSLRTVLLTAAALVVAVLGVRYLVGLDGGVSIVDNSPASTSEDSGEQGSGENVPVVEVEVGEDETESTEPAATDDSSAVEESDEVAVGDAEGESRFRVVGDPVSVAEPPAYKPAPDPEPKADSEPAEAAASSPESASPCVVRTDGRPKEGEIGFVTFNFDGPYAFLDGTSIDVPGDGGGSAIFPGIEGTRTVTNGRTFPFVVAKSMFKDDEFSVKTTLANGEIETPCTIFEQEYNPPCTFATGKDPKVGDKAEITFAATWPWSTLRKALAFPLAPRRVSAFGDDTAIPLNEDGPHRFELTANMMTSERPHVLISLLDPDADEETTPVFTKATCRAAES